MKNHFLLVWFVICFLISGCAQSVSPTATVVTAAPNSATHVSVTTPTATKIPETPASVVSPTFPPTPSAPRGTLSLVKKLGMGTGLRLSSFGLQLSADEKRLIASTTAGIFIFSADDLSPLLSIYSPTLRPGYPLYRHIRISRDGTLAAALSLNADYYPTVKMWDLNTGSLLGEYALDSTAGDDANVIADFDISPDKTQITFVSKNGFIQVISAADGRPIKTIDQYINNTQDPLWLEYDPTGKNVHTLFLDVTTTAVQTHALDTVNWQEVSQAAADTTDFPWTAAAFAPVLSKPANFKWGYFTRWGSRTIQAWEYTRFDKRFDIKRKDAISAISFSPDGQRVVMGGTAPAQLEVWAVDTVKAPLQTFPLTSPLWAAAADSSGQRFYGITSDGNLGMWKSGQAEPVHQQAGFLPIGSHLSFSDDGSGLQLSIADNKIYEINAQDGGFISIHPNPVILPEMKDKVVISTSMSADKSMLAVLYFSIDDHAIRLFDMKSGKFIRKIPSKNWLESIAFAPDGKSIFGFSRNKPVQILDVETGKVLQEIAIDKSLGQTLTEMQISRDQSSLLLIGETGVVEIYHTAPLELFKTVDTGPNSWSMGISDDGSLLAYYSLDGTLNSWDLIKDRLLTPVKLDFPANIAETTSLAFSPDNHSLAFSTWDGLIRIYNDAP